MREKIRAGESIEIILSREEIESIQELERPCERIVQSIESEIEKGEYGLILGEDSGGRIPAYILGHVLQSLSQKNNLVPPTVRFIAGADGLEELIQKIELRALEHGGELKRILFVTELISSGRTIQPIIEACKKSGVKTDVATIALNSKPPTVLGLQLGCRVVSGRLSPLGMKVPKILDSTLTGVKKNRPNTLYAAQDPFSDDSSSLL